MLSHVIEIDDVPSVRSGRRIIDFFAAYVGPYALRVAAIQVEAPSVAQSDLGKLLEIDKAWHGLHYLLTGSAQGAEGPLGQAILGGAEIGDDGGYGPARYLIPDDVTAVSIALENVSDAELRNRYDASALLAAKIYPGGWDDPESLEWLLDAFGELQSFYRGAAARGSAALLFIR